MVQLSDGLKFIQFARRNDVDTENAIKYLSGEGYLPHILAQDPSEKLLKKLGVFLQEFSRRLGLFAVHNNLCDVEIPSIPEFVDIFSRVLFWLDVCQKNLKRMKVYIYNAGKLLNESVRELNIYLKRILTQLANLFNSTIWLGWNSLETRA